MLTRLLSSLFLAPIALAAVWLGTPWLSLLVAIAAAAMVWEWGRLTGWAWSLPRMAVIVGVAAGALLATLASIPAAVLLALGGAGAVTLFGRSPQRPWAVGGLLWIVLPCIGFVWLRGRGVAGLTTALWLLITVWAIDTAAFLVGRALGGPRLAPAISPHKTWAGLAGGVAAAAGVGVAAAYLAGSPHGGAIAAIGAALAIVEQMGDMAESYAKRRFGAKDSSALIPGHGGLLDRLDGMLAVISAVVVLTIAAGGSVFTWP